MSHRLEEFLTLISRDLKDREETEIGSFVSWLRRRVALFKNAGTSAVTEIIRHCEHVSGNREDILFQQGMDKDSSRAKRFYVVLRGSTSMFVNPFLLRNKHGPDSRSSRERPLSDTYSSVLLPATPKSASSKRTSQSRMSQMYRALVEESEREPSGEQSDSSLDDDDGYDKLRQEDSQTENGTTNLKIGDTSPQTPIPTPVPSNQSSTETHTVIPLGQPQTDKNVTVTVPQPATPNQSVASDHRSQSKSSKRSRKGTPRKKLGKFVLKFEKGNYFPEDDLLDEDMKYNSSMMFDEKTDILVIEEDIFNQHLKEHHEKEITTMSNFVDIHPFFASLPPHSRGVLQISLKSQYFPAGSFIIKQGNTVNKLAFLVSGSAEVIMEPGKHRYQYSSMWPFETSNDVYFNECEWLRESRRRVYKEHYDYGGEVSRRLKRKEDANAKRKHEISICAVQSREVIGITEILLDLPTYMSSLRCLHDSEIYTINLKPFRRLIRRKHPEVVGLLQSYVLMKLRFRLDNNLGAKVPLLYCLYNMVDKQVREKSDKGSKLKNLQKKQEQEKNMLKLIEWFKLDKAPLLRGLDPTAIDLMEEMKEKAKVRKSVRTRMALAGGPEKEFMRIGCLASVKKEREPLSLYKLRNPMNELLLKLRAEGTMVSDERELEELLLRYSITPVESRIDVQTQASKVTDEEYRLLRYRRYGNRLVRNFVKMLDKRDPRQLLGYRERHVLSSVLLDRSFTETDEDEENKSVMFAEDWEALDRPLTRTTTYKSIVTTNTYKSLQFERRSVTPGTINSRLRDFHARFGAGNDEINQLPKMTDYREIHDEYSNDSDVIAGGKVFVTTVPCVSCLKNVHLKNHTHIRCQMLHSLPKNKIRGYTNRKAVP